MLVGPDDRRGGSQVRRVKAAETTRVVSFGCAFKGRRARKNLVTGCQKVSMNSSTRLQINRVGKKTLGQRLHEGGPKVQNTLFFFGIISHWYP